MALSQFHEICRLCLERADFLLSLYGEMKFLIDKIKYCTKIEIDFSDGLPPNICKACVTKLDNAYEFRKLCEESDDILRKYLSLKSSDNIPEPVEQLQDVIEIRESDLESDLCEDNAEDNISDDLLTESTEPEFLLETESQVEIESQASELSLDTCRPQSPIPEEIPPVKSEIFICEICGRTLKSPYSLQSHLNTHNDIKPFACPKCPKKFKLKYSLKIHYSTHTGKRILHSCKICSRTFVQNRNLAEHMRLHTGETPFKCESCNQNFRRKALLKRHYVTVHWNERKFKCNQCSFSFNLKSMLVAHLKSHSDERPFACTVCKKAFKYKKNLKLHMRIHTNEKPYKCEICSKTFRYNNLNSHLQAKHNVIVVTNAEDSES